jgi:competence protein ComGC
MDQPPPVPTTQVQVKNCGLAVWSLVLGILSLTCFWLLAAVPAVICGHLAYSRIRRSAGALSGEGLALGGLITGYVGIALSIFVIPVLAAIAVPNFVKARTEAQMHACVANLLQIDGAKQMWALDHKKVETDKPTAQDLAPYLKIKMICPAGGTYTINSLAEKPTCSVPGHELTSP